MTFKKKAYTYIIMSEGSQGKEIGSEIKAYPVVEIDPTERKTRLEIDYNKKLLRELHEGFKTGKVLPHTAVLPTEIEEIRKERRASGRMTDEQSKAYIGRMIAIERQAFIEVFGREPEEIKTEKTDSPPQT